MTRATRFDPIRTTRSTCSRATSRRSLVPDGNPSFWGGYIEAGYFLTGETRGYKNGAWDRTKVLKPFSKGGMGAFQVNGRVDYLDLDSGKLHEGCTNNFATGVCTARSINYTRGGKQLGLQAGLTWIPEDYVRVLLNYSHAFVKGGPFADEVEATVDRIRTSTMRIMASTSSRHASRSTSKLLPSKRICEASVSRTGPFCLTGRIDRPRPMLLVQRDEGEQAFGDLDVGRAAVAGGDDLDADRHRGAADPFDLGEHADHVAQVDRRDELHPLDRDGRDRPASPARGDDAGRDVHLATGPSRRRYGRWR